MKAFWRHNNSPLSVAGETIWSFPNPLVLRLLLLLLPPGAFAHTFDHDLLLNAFPVLSAAIFLAPRYRIRPVAPSPQQTLAGFPPASESTDTPIDPPTCHRGFKDGSQEEDRRHDLGR